MHDSFITDKVNPSDRGIKYAPETKLCCLFVLLAKGVNANKNRVVGQSSRQLIE